MDVAWNRRAIFSDANTAEAVELQETAPPRERRPPMHHIVARRVQFGTALVQSMDGITASQWTCRALARDAGKANSYQPWPDWAMLDCQQQLHLILRLRYSIVQKQKLRE